jgi:hypothetical protein
MMRTARVSQSVATYLFSGDDKQDKVTIRGQTLLVNEYFVLDNRKLFGAN